MKSLSFGEKMAEGLGLENDKICDDNTTGRLQANRDSFSFQTKKDP